MTITLKMISDLLQMSGPSCLTVCYTEPNKWLCIKNTFDYWVKKNTEDVRNWTMQDKKWPHRSNENSLTETWSGFKKGKSKQYDGAPNIRTDQFRGGNDQTIRNLIYFTHVFPICTLENIWGVYFREVLNNKPQSSCR